MRWCDVARSQPASAWRSATTRSVRPALRPIRKTAARPRTQRRWLRCRLAPLFAAATYPMTSSLTRSSGSLYKLGLKFDVGYSSNFGHSKTRAESLLMADGVRSPTTAFCHSGSQNVGAAERPVWRKLSDRLGSEVRADDCPLPGREIPLAAFRR